MTTMTFDGLAKQIDECESKIRMTLMDLNTLDPKYDPAIIDAALIRLAAERMVLTMGDHALPLIKQELRRTAERLKDECPERALASALRGK